MKYFLSIVILMLFISGCSKEELLTEDSRHDLWLIHKNAKLPIVVEGNTLSKIFIILLHGGPGGSAQVFNAESKALSDPLEKDYAMVYYDQRNTGIALGDWDEETLSQVQGERNKSISQYEVITEDAVFDLIRLAAGQINRDKLLTYTFNSPLSSIYTDNYDPFRIIINGNRDKKLIT